MSDSLFSSPAISVVMSCFNAERWLTESITSALQQTWSDFEFVIVDDGSTDKTRAMIESFAARDSRIVTLFKGNTGLADSLNVGIGTARGSWIARLDADDVCKPERLERQLCAVAADPTLVFVGSGLTLIDEEGRAHSLHHYPVSHSRLLAHLVTGRKFPAHSSALFDVDAFWKAGGYRTRIRKGQDWDLWLRLSEIGHLGCLRDVLVEVRKHEAQISNEDGGKRQMSDAYVAAVSYWLRQMGYPDPVAEEESRFESFRLWVAARLDEVGRSDLEGIRSSLKAGAARGAWHLARTAIGAPVMAARIGMEKLWGHQLPRRLAKEWIEQTGGRQCAP